MLVNRFNLRWARGRPTNDLAVAGVLMRTLDGDGIGPNGFQQPDLKDPLQHAWNSNPHIFSGDRLHASLVNARHPDLSSCTRGCPSAWVELPGLILSGSKAVSDRVLCAGWRDMASMRYNCFPLGKDHCTPGCPSRELWGDKQGGVGAQSYCSLTDNPWEMTHCATAWPISQLSDMMRMQDTHSPWGSTSSRYANEIIIDKWHTPWRDWKEIVEAVYVLPQASAQTLAFGKAVHQAILIQRGGDPLDIPFVTYDSSRPVNPFSLVVDE